MTTKAERDEALAQLHKWLKPGDTVYTILRHVSRSGMQRHISVVLLNIPEAEKPIRGLIDLHPNYSVAKAIGMRLSRGHNDAIVVGGAGMDMGFHIVYNLSRVMYPNGYGCIGEGCPSNDHSNGDRDYTPHSIVNYPGTESAGNAHSPPGYDHWHKDGGYALKHRWL